VSTLKAVLAHSAAIIQALIAFATDIGIQRLSSMRAATLSVRAGTSARHLKSLYLEVLLKQLGDVQCTNSSHFPGGRKIHAWDELSKFLEVLELIVQA
jgi:hypothetical protein